MAGSLKAYERMVSMVLTNLKQKCPGSAAGLLPFANSGMGMQTGADPDGFGPGAEQYSQLIGKPLISREDNLVRDKEEQQRRKRARRANEIFRSISQNAGLQAFFFDKFLVWSDYVEGRLNDEELTERVLEEVRRKAGLLDN